MKLNEYQTLNQIQDDIFVIPAFEPESILNSVQDDKI